MYEELKKDLAEGLKRLCEMKQITLIDVRACKDHVYMYLEIPLKVSVSEVMAYVKGKSTLMLFYKHPEYRSKCGDRHFWARDYYVASRGKSMKTLYCNIYESKKKTIN